MRFTWLALWLCRCSMLLMLCWPQLSNAQTRVVSLLLGGGITGSSGALAGDTRELLTFGLAAERRVRSNLSIGIEATTSRRKGGLAAHEPTFHNSAVDVWTVGIAPILRFRARDTPRGYFRFATAGLLAWAVVDCAVSAEGGPVGIGSTESCGDFRPAGHAGAPLDGLQTRAGASLLGGVGLGKGRVVAELRAEQALGGHTSAESGAFRFGGTSLSMLLRAFLF